MKFKEIVQIVWAPVVAASLCCLSPLILVVFGLGSVSFAASLANTFYGDYRWLFRAVGLILFVISLVIFYRKKGVCTFDAVKRKKNEILNTILVTLIAGVAGYVVWLYVVVHYAGVWLDVWK